MRGRHLASGLRVAAVVLLSAALSGCPGDERANARCGEGDTCLPGFQCVDAVCVLCEGTECTNTVVEGIGEAGGTVCLEPDGVCIDVPQGALSTTVDVTIRRASAGVSAGDFVLVSRAYVIGPAGTRFAVPAKVRIPIDASEPFMMVHVYRAEAIGEAWQLLDDPSTTSEAQGRTDHLSLFVAAKPKPVIVFPDAGEPDMGFEPDAATDTGVGPWDSGQTPLDTGFAAEVGPRDAVDPVDSGITDREVPDDDAGLTDIEAPRTDTGAVDAEAPREDAGATDAQPPSDDTGTRDASDPGMDDGGTSDAEEPGMDDTGTSDAEEPGMEDTGTTDADQPGMEDSGTSDAEEPSVGDTGSSDAEDPIDPSGDSGTADADDDPSGPDGGGPGVPGADGSDDGGGPPGPGDEDGGGGPPGPGDPDSGITD